MTASVSDPSRRGSGGTSCRWSRRMSADLRRRDRGAVRRRGPDRREGGLGPRRFFLQRRIVVEVSDEFPAEYPHVIDVFPDSPRCEGRRGEGFQEGPEQCDQLFARRQIFFQSHPGAGPAIEIPAVIFKVMTRRGKQRGLFWKFALSLSSSHAATHHDSKSLPSRFPGFVYLGGPLQFRR